MFGIFFRQVCPCKIFSPQNQSAGYFSLKSPIPPLEEEKQAEPEFMSLDLKEKQELFWIITFIIVAVYIPRLCPDNLSQYINWKLNLALLDWTPKIMIIMKIHNVNYDNGLR